MVKLFVNGLFYNNKTAEGLLVNIFDNQSTNGSLGKIIFSGVADKSGSVIGEIDNKYIGKEIIIGIIEPGFIPIQTKVTVSELGLFYSVRLDFDRTYNGNGAIISNQFEWNSLENFNKSQTEIQGLIRKFKFQNFGVKYAHYLIIFISIGVGLIADFPYNLGFAIMFFIISELLGPFAIGLKPFWIKK